jgi:hypothetical protein
MHNTYSHAARQAALGFPAVHAAKMLPLPYSSLSQHAMKESVHVAKQNPVDSHQTQ